jgi:hypothetical protein
MPVGLAIVATTIEVVGVVLLPNSQAVHFNPRLVGGKVPTPPRRDNDFLYRVLLRMLPSHYSSLSRCLDRRVRVMVSGFAVFVATNVVWSHRFHLLFRGSAALPHMADVPLAPHFAGFIRVRLLGSVGQFDGVSSGLYLIEQGVPNVDLIKAVVYFHLPSSPLPGAHLPPLTLFPVSTRL